MHAPSSGRRRKAGSTNVPLISRKTWNAKMLSQHSRCCLLMLGRAPLAVGPRLAAEAGGRPLAERRRLIFESRRGCRFCPDRRAVPRLGAPQPAKGRLSFGALRMLNPLADAFFALQLRTPSLTQTCERGCHEGIFACAHATQGRAVGHGEVGEGRGHDGGPGSCVGRKRGRVVPLLPNACRRHGRPHMCM